VIEHCNFFVALLQENMSRMLMVTDVQDIIKRHQAQIITSLKDPDIRLTLSVLHFMKIL
jgi:AP-2 complex subunit alpha